MKYFVILVATFMFTAVSWCQTAASSEQLIKRMISSGVLEGHDQKVIGRMGDAAAVAVTKVLGERIPSPSEIESILIILNMSFADPTFVETPSDREPRTALFILQYFDSSTKDLDLKKKISETRRYIQEQFLKASPGAPR